MFRSIAIVFLICISGAASSCTNGEKGLDDPRRQLTDYISKSFAVRTIDDRRELLDHLGGEAKSRLAAWSDDQFREAFIESKKQFIKLAIQETKSLSQAEVNITYELTYLDQSKGRDAKVTNKKLAQLKLEQGRWLIGEVRNIKELVEYRNEMSLP